MHTLTLTQTDCFYTNYTTTIKNGAQKREKEKNELTLKKVVLLSILLFSAFLQTFSVDVLRTFSKQQQQTG